MPGMTPASGFPVMWAASGLSLPNWLDRIIQTALRKRPGLRLAPACKPGPRLPLADMIVASSGRYFA